MAHGILLEHSIWRKPSAWLPVAFSFAALTVVVVALVANGGAPQERDEGVAAHLWQLLMLANALGMGYFLVRWVAVAPRSAVAVLLVQIAAALCALAPVWLLHL